MEPGVQRIRPFLGSRDYDLSRAFYRELGFEERVLSEKMCVFNCEQVWFYLQKYYVPDWVDNTMVFLEVADLDTQHAAIAGKNLPERYPGVRLSDIQENDWGREFFLHDPAGNLWHIGTFGQ